ncbi:DUF1918 domain-containing protein [Streptomyces sp. NPDC046985]|uniref:DUF1918 domain-containing protein n=1 Tax=Streptomyces sp. NPDC046985 TaxID=3155377 RepID=UPI0033C8DED9
MHAQLGDRLVVESPVAGSVRRDGEIIGLHHDDGTPPYDVRWSDTGEITLVFPGPDARVRHPGDEAPPTAAAAEPLAAGADSRAADAATQPDDLGRRVSALRRRRGLSLGETARRARMSPQYLACLEARPSDPSLGTLLRLADALGTTLDRLRGAGAGPPPGPGRELLHPHLRDLGPEACRAALSTRDVGRVALNTADGPAVFAVEYDMLDDAVVFRTATDSGPAAAVGAEVAFEVDHVDEEMSRGWSVLAVGRAEAVTDPETRRLLDERFHSAPSAGDPHTLWVRIRPVRLTGRRIMPAGL